MVAVAQRKQAHSSQMGAGSHKRLDSVTTDTLKARTCTDAPWSNVIRQVVFSNVFATALNRF